MTFPFEAVERCRYGVDDFAVVVLHTPYPFVVPARRQFTLPRTDARRMKDTFSLNLRWQGLRYSALKEGMTVIQAVRTIPKPVSQQWIVSGRSH